MFDYNDMLIFAKVVEHKSFTSAAEVLKMPKSTVSRRVSQLEASLGVRLLERTTRRLNLTEVGINYYQHCQRMFEEATLANSQVENSKSTPSGLLKVNASLSIGQHLLSPLLAKFLGKYPELKLQLLTTNRVVDLIYEGFDVAIRAGELNDSSLVAKRLGYSCLNLYASKSYIEQFGQPQKLAELEQHPCLVMAKNDNKTHWKLYKGKNVFTAKIKPQVHIYDFSILKQLTKDSMGIAILPDYLVAADDSDLVKILPDYCADKVEINMVYPSRLGVTAKLKVFQEFLKKELEEKLLQQ